MAQVLSLERLRQWLTPVRLTSPTSPPVVPWHEKNEQRCLYIRMATKARMCIWAELVAEPQLPLGLLQRQRTYTASWFALWYCDSWWQRLSSGTNRLGERRQWWLSNGAASPLPASAASIAAVELTSPRCRWNYGCRYDHVSHITCRGATRADSHMILLSPNDHIAQPLDAIVFWEIRHISDNIWGWWWWRAWWWRWKYV